MCARKSSGEKPEKKSPIKIRPIPRKHAGKITEPWSIMERLIEEVDAFAHLKLAKIKLWWQKDWKTDVDNIATGAQVCKASEIDRNLAEESNGETVDLFIKLPEMQWPTLDDTEKEHRLYHELCHIKAAKDSSGKQKRDAKDRLLWRLGRHPITAFHEEIERYGLERVIGHNKAIVDAIVFAEKPLEKVFVEADENAKAEGNAEPKNGAANPDAWKKVKLDSLGLKARTLKALEANNIKTLGQLTQLQKDQGEWWVREVKGLGETGSADLSECCERYWKENPAQTAA
jgi:hypothetical protein